MKKITYVFSGGRKFLLESKKINSEEFFYGFTFLKRNSYDVEIIEFDESLNRNNLFLKYFDKIFSKLFSLPFYTQKILSRKNIKKIYNSDHIFLVNEGVGLSSLPILILLKIFKNIKVSLFSMGLFSKKINFPFLKIFHNFFIKIMIIFSSEILFLGKPEYNFAIKNFNNYKNKFFYFPWCVDDEFWKNETDFVPDSNTSILFIGNDSNRDYETLVQISQQMKDLKFLFVTNNEYILNQNIENVEIINGNWSKNLLTDNEIKKMYNSARLSIIPLKNSLQPSGQSVALQSMSMGVPVLITKTKGFWDYEKFENNKNIIFVENNKIETWVKEIRNIYNNTEKLETLIHEAHDLINKNYTKKIFNENLLKRII